MKRHFKIALISLKLLLLGVVLCATNVNAQITIKIIAEKDSLPVVFAPVKWKVIQTGQVLQSQANENGFIVIYSQGSPVIVTIAYLGYELLRDTVLKDGNHTLRLKNDLKYLPEAVVTDQYTATNPDKSINKVVLIDAKKIKAMGAVNLNDVLSNQLNVKLTQDNLLGSGMSLMGISGQNVKILVDGIPVIGRQNGNIDLSQINMNDVERIEIIEGPLSVAYGTNALAGAINIITKKKPSHKVDVNTTAYYESTGKYNLTLNAGLRKTNGIYNFSGGRNYFDGWSAVKLNRYQDWKPKEQYFGRFQYVRKIGRFDLTLKTEYLQEKLTNKGLPRQPYYETAFDEYYKTRRYDNSITATAKLPKNRYWNLMAAYNIYTRTKNRYLFNRVTLDKTLVPESNEQDTNTFKNLVLRGTYTKSLLNARLNYQIGYDINSETGTGKKIEGKSKTISDFATFLSLEISPIEALVIKPGIRLSHNTAFKSVPLPSLNLKFNKKNFTIRGSYARGFRAPDLKELYLYFVDVNHNVTGNPNLNAEKSNNFQFSVNKKFIHKTRIIQPELAVYYNEINDRIILANVQGLEYTYRNLSFFKSISSNASITIKAGNFNCNLGYAANISTVDKTGFENAFTNHEVTANVGYWFKKYDFTANVFLKVTSKSTTFILDDIGNTQQTSIDAYQLIDFSLSKSFLNNRIAVVTGIKNLANITNLQTTGNVGGVHSTGSNQTLFGTGRTFFLKLDYFFYRK